MAVYSFLNAIVMYVTALSLFACGNNVQELQGNTHGKRSSSDPSSGPSSRMQTPVGSPLGYTPPIESPREQGHAHFALSGNQGPEAHAYAGWPAQPKLVPTVIQCKHTQDLIICGKQPQDTLARYFKGLTFDLLAIAYCPISVETKRHVACQSLCDQLK